MPNHRITRREALVASAAAALPLAVSSSASAATTDATKTYAPVVGVSTLGFRDFTNAQLAEEFAKQGITDTQLFLLQKDSNYWKYNGRNDVSDMTDARCKAIADTYRSKGIAIHSIGVYTNLIHADEAERAANLTYFGDMMRIGAAMDVRVFVTEAGHYHPEGPAPAIPYHYQEEVWRRTVAVGKELAALAEKNDATVLIEPSFRGFFASAKRTRVFIEEVGSPRMRILLDPANLLEVNDQEEMFAQLGPYIDCLHAKDFKLHANGGVGAGKGDLDYDRFVALAAKHTPDAPFFLEYVGAKDYLPALALLQDALRRH
jgi:sugar phosphate isomerase/epimerase